MANLLFSVMNKHLWLTLLVMLTSLPGLACDLCGCSNSGSFFGILPQAHRRFLGVRYRYSTYDSHLNSVNLRTRETFQTAEFWGRFYPARRLQVLAFVPYQFSHQTLVKSGQTLPLQGLGDVSAMAQYNLLNTFMDDSAAHQVNHNLLVGGGVKLPTGRYRYDESDLSQVANPNFQLGTGSLDWLLNAIYTVRYGRWGANVDAAYRITSTNAQGYRFGNRLNGSASVFYVAERGNWSVMPNAGVFVEQYAHDRRDGVVNKQTGGYVAYLGGGVEAYGRRLSAGFSYRQPMAQYLSAGELQARAQWSSHLTVLF